MSETQNWKLRGGTGFADDFHRRRTSREPTPSRAASSRLRHFSRRSLTLSFLAYTAGRAAGDQEQPDFVIKRFRENDKAITPGDLDDRNPTLADRITRCGFALQMPMQCIKKQYFDW
jgi:hypothetical protein